MRDNHFKFSLSVLALPLFCVLSLWIVFWVERKFHFDASGYGIYPRTSEGFRGVIFSPFIHGDIEHLYNNSIPLLILIAALRYFYRSNSLQILGFGILISGTLTWIIGRDSYHIGASGLVYVLVGFIFFKGIITQYYRLVALSLIVVLLYGSLVWHIFPETDKGISWEGHLSGFLTGFIFAVYFKTPAYKKIIKYDWEQPDYDAGQDKFMQRFDENGNFKNIPKVDENWEYFVANLDVIYDYKTTDSNTTK